MTAKPKTPRHWEHFVTTLPLFLHCRCCNSLVLAGYSEGIRAAVDPRPLNTKGHTAAILAELHIYKLTRTGLVHIGSDRIRDKTIQGPILAQHRCGDLWPTEYLETAPPQHTAPTAQNERIPY